ncbi:hypothetical protein H4R18_004271 [Coemansia javaensis]|uniref:Uncharacterized protein n=1 Tax=Coemansia javaensis TaxID=2761396 RepID=A0A9W8LH58_9FUNG|nr:hypothetical protein H4R18_004271 [Coemansia javaensis]
MDVNAISGSLLSAVDPSKREGILTALTGVKVTNPSHLDTVTIAVCSALFGVTAAMLVYAWFNHKYRPIRAKNLTWTTLMYVSALLWFIGNIPANGHVDIARGWRFCKMWIVWFRVLFCFVFASMTIVRFYALDHVFNQKKPFTTFNSILAFGIVVALNVTYCLVNQLISDNLTVGSFPALQVCNVTQAFRISALTFQWVMWLGVGVLMFRLRNIQSSFNEFRESIAVFAVIIALLIESTVVNVHYPFYILEQNKRIEKTVMDSAGSNLVIWIIIAYPVLMSIFRRREYERRWLDKLADDSRRIKFARYRSGNGVAAALANGDALALQECKTSPESPGSSALHHASSNDATIGAAFACDNILMRDDMSLRYAMLNSPALFDPDLTNMTVGGRRVL